MSSKLLEFEFQVRVDDRTFGGAYVKLRRGKVHHAEVIKEDILLADYDKKGRLLGIDILSAVDASLVIELVDDPQQQSALKGVLKNRLGDLLKAA